MTDDAWQVLQNALRARLEAMPESGVVILTGPDEEPSADAPRRGLFRRKPVPPTPPYVQFLAIGKICAECVGPGLRDIPEAVQEQLAGLGWTIPLENNPAQNYQRWFDPVEAAAAAELGIRTLQLLGADPASLKFRAWAD